MLQSYSPIGKFIFLTHKNPKALGDDTVLKNNLEVLVQSLKDNVKTYGLITAQQRMEDELFNFRFEILTFLNKHPNLLEDIESTIIEQIGEKYFSLLAADIRKNYLQGLTVSSQSVPQKKQTTSSLK